ncbi:MAG: glycosyl hydrolase 53 family protein [Nitrosomonas sp.]
MTSRKKRSTKISSNPTHIGRRPFLLAGLASLSSASPVALVGCGGGGEESSGVTDVTAPTLMSQVPAAGASAVSRTSVVRLTFSERVTVASGALTLSTAAAPVESSIAVTGQEVTLRPVRKLGFGKRYTVSALNTGIKDAIGNSYLGSSSTFTTIERNSALALGAVVMDTYLRRRWTEPSRNPWDVLPDLADNGFEWLRVAVTTRSFPELRATTAWHTIPFKSEYWSSLEVSGALLREAADLGFRLHAVLFLSHQAADAGEGRQARPAEWTGLTEAEVETRVQQHATAVATYYKSLGLDIEVFEIGNEIDFGVCGIRLGETVAVPGNIDAVNDPIWMRDNLWKLGAPLLKAAIRGVRAVYSDAKILLHVAGFGYSRLNIAATGFFQSMIDLGVPFDIAGLSFPYQFNGPDVAQPYFANSDFLATLNQIANLGRPLQIVEFSYPADPSGTSKTPASKYPFTPAGQAAFIGAFAEAVRGKVDSIFYFYPDYYAGFAPSSPELEGGGLFNSTTTARPGLEVFNAIAESRLLA